MDSVKISNYIESLRYGINMSQEDFIEGITSPRQYQRYRSGECEIPLVVISKFCKRLEIPERKLFAEFEELDSVESKWVKEYFNLVLIKDFISSTAVKNKLEQHNFIDEERKKFYYCATIIQEYYQGKLSNIEFTRELCRIIKYDKTIKRSLINDFQLYILGIIMEHNEKYRLEILEVMVNVFRKKIKFISGVNLNVNLQSLFWICKTLGRIEDFKGVLEHTKIAINICVENRTIYLMEYFYYYEALSNFYLGEISLFNSKLLKLINLLYYLDGEKKERFFKKIRKEFMIEPQEFIIEKIKETV